MKKISQIYYLCLISVFTFLAADEQKPTAEGIKKEQLLGPFRHQNLELYLVRPMKDAVENQLSIITLEEGLNSGQVIVRETGKVNQLTIENNSKHHLYVHGGDIVKGGKQDRVIQNGFTLAPGNNSTNVQSFCV